MQNRKQRRVHDHRLGLADEIVEDSAAQRLEKASKLSCPAVEGGRSEAEHPGEQVREEPLGVAQEGAFALDAAQLLEEGEGQDFGVREPFERSVAVAFRIEEAVGVVDEAEQDDDRLFRPVEPWSKVSEGHLLLLVEGSRMALVLLSIHATLI